MRLAILPVLLATLTTPALAQSQYDDVLETHKELLAANGIPKAMARSALIWGDGQYYIGRCLAYVSQGDLRHWRMWWHDTQLEQSEFGRELIEMGNQAYYDGVQESRSEPLAQDQCERLLQNWVAELEASLETPQGASSTEPAS